MKLISKKSRKWGIILTGCLAILFKGAMGYAAEKNNEKEKHPARLADPSGRGLADPSGRGLAEVWPIKVKIIEKPEAKYDTPENSYAAKISALVKGDPGWYYETLTKKSREGRVDPKRKIEAIKDIKEIYIVGKQTYKNGVMLFLEVHNEDGSVQKGPSVYLKENGLWKGAITEFSGDKKLKDYMNYIPPAEKH